MIETKMQERVEETLYSFISRLDIRKTEIIIINRSVIENCLNDAFVTVRVKLAAYGNNFHSSNESKS